MPISEANQNTHFQTEIITECFIVAGFYIAVYNI